MKATEVFVEQVLIGFLLLLALALLFSRELGEAWRNAGLDPDVPLQIAAGMGLVGTAYLVGIPFDRFVDTVLARVEQRLRLDYAAELHAANPTDGDPFPVGAWRMAVLRGEAGALAYMNYLRSRIRLSRALAVSGPALTLAAMLAVAPERSLALAVSVGVGLLVLYAIAFQLGAKHSLPKTGTMNHATWKRGKFLAEPAARCLALANFGSLALCLLLWDARVFGVAVAGDILTSLSAWSWVRITRTFHDFLKDFNAA